MWMHWRHSKLDLPGYTSRSRSRFHKGASFVRWIKFWDQIRNREEMMMQSSFSIDLQYRITFKKSYVHLTIYFSNPMFCFLSFLADIRREVVYTMDSLPVHHKANIDYWCFHPHLKWVSISGSLNICLWRARERKLHTERHFVFVEGLKMFCSL